MVNEVFTQTGEVALSARGQGEEIIVGIIHEGSDGFSERQVTRDMMGDKSMVYDRWGVSEGLLEEMNSCMTVLYVCLSIYLFPCIYIQVC